MRRSSSNSSNREDNLKNIRPFTEDQLLSLHPIYQIDQQEDFLNRFLQDCIQAQETEFFQQLSKLKKWKFLLESKTRIYCTEKLSHGKILENQYWSLNNQVAKGKTRCSDGRLVEIKHNYQEAVASPGVLTSIGKCYESLRDQIAVNHAAHLFASQYNEKQVEILIKSAILNHAAAVSPGHAPLTDQRGPRNGLPVGNGLEQVKVIKNLITCLFAFIRCEQETKSEHFQSLKEWLTQLIEILLRRPGSGHEARLFLLHHVLRCCGGISDWAIGFVQCPSPLDADTMDQAMAYMNDCLNMISTILSPVRYVFAASFLATCLLVALFVSLLLLSRRVSCRVVVCE